MFGVCCWYWMRGKGLISVFYMWIYSFLCTFVNVADFSPWTICGIFVKKPAGSGFELSCPASALLTDLCVCDSATLVLLILQCDMKSGTLPIGPE